jgi:predicted amidohydrolase
MPQVAALQWETIFAQPEENRKLVQYFLQRDKTSPLCYLVLPEMCCTGYCFTSRKQIQSLVEPVQVRMLNTLDNQTPTTGTLSLSLSLSLYLGSDLILVLSACLGTSMLCFRRISRGRPSYWKILQLGIGS